MNRVTLGSLVEDKVTGFRGIAVSRVEYLNWCFRIGVQAKVKKDADKTPEWQYFDEPQLKVIKANVIQEGDKEPGGERPNAPQR